MWKQTKNNFIDHFLACFYTLSLNLCLSHDYRSYEPHARGFLAGSGEDNGVQIIYFPTNLGYEVPV